MVNQHFFKRNTKKNNALKRPEVGVRNVSFFVRRFLNQENLKMDEREFTNPWSTQESETVGRQTAVSGVGSQNPGEDIQKIVG